MVLLASLLALAAAVAEPTLSRSADIEAPGPSGALKGTLAGPATPDRPVVLIIPGSGPTDRDGNNPLGVSAAPYRHLAEGLANRQISSVRIDKRGMFASASAAPDPNAVTVDDYVRDTQAWIAATRQRTGARCVWLLGHSEGGLVALAAAAAQPEHLCGLILTATAGRPLGDVLKDQLRANPANAPLLDPADKAIDRLAAGEHVDAKALPQPLLALFRPEVQGFLISAFRLDPAKLIQQVPQPVLILQGERDLQVSVSDAEALKRARPEATLTLLPGVNHVLKPVAADDVQANLATYADPNLAVAPQVIDAIAGFVAPRSH